MLTVQYPSYVVRQFTGEDCACRMRITPGRACESAVRFFNIVADQTGRRVEERRVLDGSTIADLLGDLAAEHPALSRYARGGAIARP